MRLGGQPGFGGRQPRSRPAAHQPRAAGAGRRARWRPCRLAVRRAGGRAGRRPRRQARGRGCGAAAATDDDTDVIVAGLVGSGGGGLTPMVFAAREGDVESTKLLLAAGADVNQATEYGWTPLLTATNNRHYELGEFLIEHGANVNQANKGNWTPLYLATDNRNIEGGDFPVPKPDIDHLDFIKFLLDHSADPNIRVKDNTLTRTIFTMQWFLEAGATPFIRAAQSGDLELLKLLLAHGADPMITTDHGDTALTAAAGMGWVEGVTYEHSAKDNVETVKMLLDLGLDANAANDDGRTPSLTGARRPAHAQVDHLDEHREAHREVDVALRDVHAEAVADQRRRRSAAGTTAPAPSPSDGGSTNALIGSAENIMMPTASTTAVTMIARCRRPCRPR